MMTQMGLGIDSHESRRRVAQSFMRGLGLAALNVVSLTLAGCGGGGDRGGGAVASAAPAVPRFAYLANAGDDTVSIYTVNAATGQLQHNGHIAAGTGPTSVTVDPSGKFAYVANETSNNISAYRIDATTGALTSVGAAVAAGTGPFSVTVDPSGQFAYVTNSFNGAGGNSVSAYRIDTTTGALTQILCGGGAGCNGNNFLAGLSPRSVTVDPSDQFAYVANGFNGVGGNSVSAYRIDTTTGALTQILCGGGAGCNGNNFLTGTEPLSVTIDPSGRFAYVANSFNGVGGNSVSAYRIDTTTGALTSVGLAVTAGANPRSVTVDPSGQFAYVANGFNGVGGNSVSAYRIDATTGALTSVGAAVAAGTGPFSVTVDPSGQFAYVTNSFNGAGGNSISAYAVNATTGALTPLPTVTGRSGTVAMAMTKGTAAVTYTPKFAYAANTGSTDVSAYRIDAMTGALTQILCGGGAGCNGNNFLAGLSPRSVTVDPSGQFAYVTNSFNGVGGNSVSAYRIDATTGALTQILCGGGAGCNGNNFLAGLGPLSVTVDPSGQFAYVANGFNGVGGNSVSAYRIDTTTGALTSVGLAVTAGANPRSVTVDPSGQFAYVANGFNGVGGNSVSAYRIDTTTGALTQILCGGGAGCNGNNFLAGLSPRSVTVDPSGQFAYVANGFNGVGGNSVSAYRIDTTTGALTQILCGGGAGCNGNNFLTGTEPLSVTIDPSGRFAYVANSFNGVGGNSVSAYRIDTTTGVLTSVGAAVATGTCPFSVTVDPSGKFAYVANVFLGAGGNSVSAYRIDTTTGVLTQILCGGGAGCNGNNFLAGTQPFSVITTGAIQ